jgi:NAD(P)-dependent dehydrogenase (short-subunit alcohol dehydrogenase family)
MKYSFDDLKGRNCVITGGFGVLGMALTRGLAEAGVNLAVISRSKDNPARGEAIEKEFGVKCLGISASTLDKAALEAARDEIHEKLGKIDILINCAGGNSPKATCAVEQMDENTDLAQSFYGLDMEGFQFVYDLNFKGTLLATMVFTTDMLEAKKGVVLNISSMNAFRPLTKIPAYSAAKGSINNFTSGMLCTWPSSVSVATPSLPDSSSLSRTGSCLPTSRPANSSPAAARSSRTLRPTSSDSPRIS